MARLQTFIVSALVFIAPFAYAGQWGLALGTGAFQGTYSMAAAYDWSQTHQVELGLGRFPFAGRDEIQINFGYRYVPYAFELGDLSLVPFALGLTLNYALNQDDYFVRNPGKYPDPDYYEQTGIRAGVELSSQVMYRGDWRLLYKVVLIDSGAIAIVNNDSSYAENFLSAGLSFQYFFGK